MAEPNHIKNIAIVGAGGNSGKYMAEALVASGKFNVTALTRVGSKTPLPSGLTVKEIDYEKPETLATAMKGADALIITLPGMVPHDAQSKLFRAAVDAGVPWVLPNEWGADTEDEGLLNDVQVFKTKVTAREELAKMPELSHIAVQTGFWYEWSLAMYPCFGIDLIKHKAVLFDDGETKISISTWPQVGRAVTALLSLPVKSSDGKCLESLKNKVVYVSSFTISQKDMLASAMRVTGTTEKDWEVSKEPSHERYAAGLKEMAAGQRIGYAKMMYTRVFYPDSVGSFEHKGTLNKMLGLPEESIDEATERTIERVKTVKLWTQD